MDGATATVVRDLLMGGEICGTWNEQVGYAVSPSVSIGLIGHEGWSSTYGSSCYICFLPLVDGGDDGNTSIHSLFRCPTL